MMFTTTTTYHGAKPYAWSYSKLKNWRVCPKRHRHYDVLPKGHPEKIVEPESEQLAYGNDVHKAMAMRIEKGVPLPVPYASFEKYALALLKNPGQILVEQKVAIRRDYSACGYFADGVWFRSVADAIKIVGDVGLIVDWKTGKVDEQSEQLLLCAACVFAAYPQVHTIRSKFVWLQFDAETVVDITRADMPKLWAHLMPELQMLEQATTNEIFPPKPGYLCKNWCAVKSCQYNGKGNS